MVDNQPECQLTIEVERNETTSTVLCHGRLMSGVCSVLTREVDRLIPASKRIVLDLSDFSQMDSLGLGTLARLYVSAKSRGCELTLIHLGPRVRELLSMTNMLSVFSVIGESGHMRF